MRSNLDNNRARGLIVDGGALGTWENLAITANVTLATGMPLNLAYDPASTGRNVVLYTPTVTAFTIRHEIWNISTGTGVLTLQQPDGTTTAALIAPGQRAEVIWNPKAAIWNAFVQTNGITQTAAAQQTIQQYTTLALLTNTDVLAVPVPFKFSLNSVQFRVKRPATTAAKLATLTAQVNGVSVTGGVISLTSANCTPTNNVVAGTAITAGGGGALGNTVGVLVSAVTTFVEGDGYVEYNVTNLQASA